MEVGEQVTDLNITADELHKFTKALKDEKFRGLLLDYATELSDPENKAKYEEEIKWLEQERGNNLDFINPTPFKSLRTSLNGKQKCFINICANEKVDKPAFHWGVSDDGRRGQHWSLPHSLHPGRQDRDPKGNKFMIYDVIFHPDTLHMASRNPRFMDMLEHTSINGIQDAFDVILDKNNVREMTVKYKGTPQPCVIRKPIPGYKAKEPPAQPDPLAFPYPDEERPTAAPTTEPTEAPRRKNSGDSKPLAVQMHTNKPKEPTLPNYTVKYRFFTDIQDFRCSRDSAQSPRPKEIVVTIDVPLLKSATDTSLEVKGKGLLLESKEPAYRLEVPLAYPVDEDTGEAKFNKQKRQLTITLSVVPSKETFDFAVGPSQTVSDHEREEEENGEEGEDKWKEQKGEGEKSEEEERSEHWEIEKSKDGDDAIRGGAAQTEDSCVSGLRWDAAVQHIGLSTEDKNSAPVDKSNTENLPISPLKHELEQSSGIEEEGGANSDSCFESRAQMKTSEARGETGKTQENADLNGHLNEVEKDPSLLNQITSDESQATASAIPGTPPSSNQTTPPSSNQTTPPSSNQTTPPSSNQTTSPSSNQTTPPSSNQTTSPSSNQTTLPSSNQTTSPSSNQTTSPSSNQTTPPSSNQTTPPSSNQTTSPSSNQTTLPSSNQTTSPSSNQTTSPSSNQTTSPSSNQTTSPSSNQTTLPSSNQTTSPSSNQTTSPSSNQTTPPSSNQTTSPSSNQTTSPSSNQTTSLSSNQTTSLSSNQTTSLSSNQTTSLSSNQTTSLSSNQTTSLSSNQTTLPSSNQTPPSSNQTTPPSSNQTTSLSSNQTTSLSSNQTTPPSSNQTTSLSSNQTTSLSSNQTTSLSSNQTTPPSSNQTTSLSSNQTTSLSSNQTTSPSSNQTTSLSSNQTTPPSSNQTTSPSSNQTTSPSSNQTTSPSSNQTTPPSSNQTTLPSSNQTTPTSSNQTTPPSSNQTTPPSSNQTTPPSSNQTSPSSNQTTSLSSNQTTPPSSNQTTPPSSNQTTSPSSNQTPPPSSNQTTLPSSNQTTPPSSNQTTSPSSNQTTSPSSNQTTSPSSNQTTSPSSNQTTARAEDCSMSKVIEEIRDAPVSNKAKKSRRKNPSNSSKHVSEELAAGSVMEREDTDKGDLVTAQTLPVPDRDRKPPPVLLREIDVDGNETVISDHSTSAGFIFQNSLLFELE